MQFGLKKLFLLTTVVAVLVALLKLLLPLGMFVSITLILAPLPFLLMMHGWRLQSQGNEERGSDYLAIGLVSSLLIVMLLLLALFMLAYSHAHSSL